MPAGIAVYNDFGTLQIDDTSPNLTFRRAGTVTPVYLGPDFGYVGTIQTSSIANTVMALARVDDMLAYKWSDDGTNMTMVMRAGNVAGGDIKWWAFATPATPTVNFGLQVKDSAGKVMFDSNQKPCWVVDAVVLNSANNWTATRTYAAGRTYAVIVSDVWFKVVGNVVTFSGRYAAQSPMLAQARTAVVIDVTGY